MKSGKNKIPDKDQVNFVAKYSALAFQMAIIIGLGTFGGFKLDQLLGFKFKIFTVVLALLSVVAAIYFAVKDLIKPKK
ncbi:MAG: AtpZ/AtpI family protein [Bacteroidales bacterium]|nr:AtpZ/AtpI family protein [Bacteroidales bacterium]